MQHFVLYRAFVIFNRFIYIHCWILIYEQNTEDLISENFCTYIQEQVWLGCFLNKKLVSYIFHYVRSYNTQCATISSYIYMRRGITRKLGCQYKRGAMWGHVRLWGHNDYALLGHKASTLQSDSFAVVKNLEPSWIQLNERAWIKANILLSYNLLMNWRTSITF